MEKLEKVKDHLKSKLDNPAYEKWIQPLKYIGTQNNIMFLGCPDPNNHRWIKDNILDSINDYTQSQFSISCKLAPLFDETDLKNNEIHQGSEASPTPAAFDSNLISKYTFTSFVQLESNKMAYSFAYNVSEFPGRSYNPLYIYSDVGLGKTHLMHAIGNRIIEKNQSSRVIYLTTNDLMYEYVEYTRLNKRSDFIKKYTSIDVLLIDDIQFITKWGGTSEQFYYIFNNLIHKEKQIVICSDKHPDNLPYLENRIKSRFQWGGVVDILHYDLEGRMAILKRKIQERKKLYQQDFEIPDEVLYFLASSIADNIRKLEGALYRLIGYANLKHADLSTASISLSFAKEALKIYIVVKKKNITLATIQEFISKKYNLKVSDLKSKNNSPRVALPRQIGMYMCKKLTKHPLNEIGKNFGGKHHTTVLHSVRKIDKMKENDPEFSKTVESYLEFFKN